MTCSENLLKLNRSLNAALPGIVAGRYCKVQLQKGLGSWALLMQVADLSEECTHLDVLNAKRSAYFIVRDQGAGLKAEVLTCNGPKARGRTANIDNMLRHLVRASARVVQARQWGDAIEAGLNANDPKGRKDKRWPML